MSVPNKARGGVGRSLESTACPETPSTSVPRHLLVHYGPMRDTSLFRSCSQRWCALGTCPSSAARRGGFRHACREHRATVHAWQRAAYSSCWNGSLPRILAYGALPDACSSTRWQCALDLLHVAIWACWHRSAGPCSQPEVAVACHSMRHCHNQ
jgi:hypothetical protein